MLTSWGDEAGIREGQTLDHSRQGVMTYMIMSYCGEAIKRVFKLDEKTFKGLYLQGVPADVAWNRVFVNNKITHKLL